MLVHAPIYNLSVDYEPKSGAYTDNAYTKLGVAILEDAILEWQSLQQYKKDTGDKKVTDSELELGEFFRSDWCQLLLSVTTPKISHDFIMDKLGVPRISIS